MLKDTMIFDKSLQRAIGFHRQGNGIAAKALYVNLMKEHSDHPDLLHFYGVYCFQSGSQAKGIKLVKQALDTSPDYLDALNNLGNMHKLQGQLDEAEVMYRRVIELHPGFYDAMVNLGVLARSRQDHTLAEHWYREAVACQPDRPLAYDNLTRLLMKLGRAREALEILSESVTKALREDSQNIEMHSLRARLMLILGDRQGAVTVYKEWLDAFPGDKHALHMQAAATGENIPDKSDPAYVKNLFDRFSETFDEVLDRLDYRAPSQVGESVNRLLGESTASLNALDAGCGTGLCAQYIKPYCARLTGVDISPGMLARARARQQYDELIEADIVDYLQSSADRHDLIVSSDTLNYFGDLQEIFDAASGALVSGGVFVFTLEMHDEHSASLHTEEADFYLNVHGRYSHSIAYVNRVMSRAGLVVLAEEQVVLRMESGKPVDGLVFSVEKPGSRQRNRVNNGT